MRHLFPSGKCFIGGDEDDNMPENLLKGKSTVIRIPEVLHCTSTKESFASVCYTHIIPSCFFSKEALESFSDIRIRIHPDNERTHIFVYEICSTRYCEHWHSKLGISILIKEDEAIAEANLMDLEDIRQRFVQDEDDDDYWCYEKASMWTVGPPTSPLHLIKNI